MEDITPIRRAVSVDETFRPSEQLRDALVEFLDPELDKKTIESLRAAFLLKSWHRRLLDRDYYNRYERGRNGTVDEATRRFAELPHTPILFDGEVGLVESRPQVPQAVVLRARPSQLVRLSYDILAAIPTIEQPSASPEAARRMYFEIAKRHLGSTAQIASASAELHQKIVHPALARRHYVEPGEVVIREIMAAVRPPRDQNGSS